MSGEIAAWQSKVPARSRYGIAGALRQALGAASRWGYMSINPAVLAGCNRQPSPRAVRAFTRVELEAIAAELSPAHRAIPLFAACGLKSGALSSAATSTAPATSSTAAGDGIVELGKRQRSRRQVPLSARGLEARELLPARLDTPLLLPADKGRVLNLDNWRRRVWAPAIEAAGIPTPARIYDLRSTFASDALAAGVGIHAPARIMGTSVAMIERHYGALLDGAMEAIAGRLDAPDAERERATQEDHWRVLDEQPAHQDRDSPQPLGRGPVVAHCGREPFPRQEESWGGFCACRRIQWWWRCWW
ncbi:MAG TPA: hypothetical protein VHR88_01805 [Solirubrobacteraceae bacterium]|jgi:integrase|nr:hypothetical protein [Solirubrobacteraceae bacterium]